MPYTELSEHLNRLGRPIPVLGLRRIEQGERRVDLDDLVALARVLKVPPVALIFPAGSVTETEILPDQSVGVWAAVDWFTGEASFPGDNGDVGEIYTEQDWMTIRDAARHRGGIA